MMACDRHWRLVRVASLLAASVIPVSGLVAQATTGQGQSTVATSAVPTVVLSLDSAKIIGRLPFDQPFFLVGSARPDLLSVRVWIRESDKRNRTCPDSVNPDSLAGKVARVTVRPKAMRALSMSLDTVTGPRIRGVSWFFPNTRATLAIVDDSANSARYRWDRPDTALPRVTAFALKISSIHPNTDYCVWVRQVLQPPDSIVQDTRAKLRKAALATLETMDPSRLDQARLALDAALIAVKPKLETIGLRAKSGNYYSLAQVKDTLIRTQALVDSAQRAATTDTSKYHAHVAGRYKAFRNPAQDSATTIQDSVTAKYGADVGSAVVFLRKAGGAKNAVPINAARLQTVLDTTPPTTDTTPTSQLLQRFQLLATSVRHLAGHDSELWRDYIHVAHTLDTLRATLVTAIHSSTAITRVPAKLAGGIFDEGIAFGISLSERPPAAVRRLAAGATEVVAFDDTVTGDGLLPSNVPGSLPDSAVLVKVATRLADLTRQAHALEDLVWTIRNDPAALQTAQLSIEDVMPIWVHSRDLVDSVTILREQLALVLPALGRLNALTDSLVALEATTEESADIAMTSSSSAPYLDRSKQYVSADLGIVGVPGSIRQLAPMSFVPYVGANVSLASVNREAQFIECPDGMLLCIVKDIELTAGITTSTIAHPPSRTDLLGSHSLYTAAGVRFLSFVRFSVGTVWLQQARADAVHGPRITGVPAASLSLDWDIGGTLGGIGGAISGGH
jgi:hypothetical protein